MVNQSDYVNHLKKECIIPLNNVFIWNPFRVLMLLLKIGLRELLSIWESQQVE